METPIIRNDWAKTYIQTRDADVYRFAKDVDLLRERVDSGKVFEHGAAPFVLSHALSREGYELYAGDASPDRFLGLDQMPFRVVQHDIEEDVLDQEFDVVICNELLEHLRVNLLDTFRSVLKSLVPGGYLFISTPNAASAQGVYNMLRRDKSYVAEENTYHAWSKLEKIGHMGHVKEYSGSEVAGLLSEIGFKVEGLFYRDPEKTYEKNNQKSYLSILEEERLFKYLLKNISVRFNPLYSVIARRPAQK